MKETVWATYYHKSSTDENPQHMFCPPGPKSWCKWRKAEANNALDTFRHVAPLSNHVLKVMKPFYELSAKSLLQRCLGAETQNNNESLNLLVWTFAPKHIHCGRPSIEISTFLPVNIFNEGFSSILILLSEMSITIG